MLVAQDFLAVDEDDLSDEEIVKHLGNSIAALHSVPTAIYCFLRAQHKIPGIEVICVSFAINSEGENVCFLDG